MENKNLVPGMFLIGLSVLSVGGGMLTNNIGLGLVIFGFGVLMAAMVHYMNYG